MDTPLPAGDGGTVVSPAWAAQAMTLAAVAATAARLVSALAVVLPVAGPPSPTGPWAKREVVLMILISLPLTPIVALAGARPVEIMMIP